MSESLVQGRAELVPLRFSETAVQLRDTALEKSALIGTVDTPEQYASAADAQGEISALIRQIGNARVQFKQPVLDYGRQIDAAAAKFVEDLKAEEMRLVRLNGDYKAAERARIQAEENARILEQQRIEEERLRAERELREKQQAEQRRLDAEQREQERLAREARNEQERIAAEQRRIEIEREKQISNAKTVEQINDIRENSQQAIAALPTPVAPTAVKGQKVTEDWTIEVTNIWELAKFHSTCVKIEPLMGEIKSLLKAGATVKGIRATPITNVRISRREPAAIEV